VGIYTGEWRKSRDTANFRRRMNICVQTTTEFPNFFDFVGYDGRREIGVLQVQGDRVLYLWIRRSCRRRGLATQLYNYACSYMGAKLLPKDVSNTTEAIGFWKGRVDEQYIESVL
jgi:ribosomal protein S18 acetylase RimI-like enzyme